MAELVNHANFDFHRFIADGAKGRLSLARTMRDLTSSSAPTELINFDALSDAAFLEPRVIGWHFGPSQNEVSIFQVLFPGLDRLPSRGVPVKSDNSGLILLAGLGSILTSQPQADFLLTCDKASCPKVKLSHSDDEINFDFTKSTRIPGTDIELVQWIDPVLKSFITQHVQASECIQIFGARQDVPQALCRALDLLKAHAPEFSTALNRGLRAIFMFEHPSLNSFAALQMHGMIFLNVNRPLTLLFFIDGIVHQGGHVIFSEATLERQRYFQVEPDTMLGEITHRTDGRTVYEALHGLYTEYALLDAFDSLRGARLTAYEKLELEARFAFVLRRFGVDLKVMKACSDKIFAREGVELLDYFHQKYIAFQQSQLGEIFDWTGQPDEFDFRQFVDRNKAMLEAMHSTKAGQERGVYES